MLDRVVDLAACPLRRIGPRSTAQARFYHFARCIAAALRPLVRSRAACVPPIEAGIVNQLITSFNRREPGFPLLVNLTGGEHLEAAERLGKGVLVATVHTNLGLSSHAALLSGDIPPLVVCNWMDRDISGWNWGHAAPLDAVEARDPMLFRKLTRHLADRRRVVCFVDHPLPTDPPVRMHISPNLFAWAQGAGIPIVVMLTRLDSDGRIEVALHREPSSDASASIDAFIRFVERQGGWRCEPHRRKTVAGRSAQARPHPTPATDQDVALAA
jgi:hypothetical protein